MYMLSDAEKADLCAFVNPLVAIGKIKPDVPDKIRGDTLTKRDLSTIQRKIDLLVGASQSPELLSAANPRDILEIQTLAAKAHRALIRLRVYDWK